MLASPTRILAMHSHVQIRKERPVQRQQFIKQGLMNPDGQMRLEDAVKLVGICTDMCPEFERVRRIYENDLKAPEYVRLLRPRYTRATC